jgi:peptide deformylase
MTAKEILKAGDYMLRMRAEPVVDFKRIAWPLASDLRDSLSDFRSRFGYGRGLSAPQIGSLHRVIFIDFPAGGFHGELINPWITRHSTKQTVWWDSCLSFDAAIFAQVRRFEKIIVGFFDLYGHERTVEASGPLSELLQHELDHLDGILFTDRLVRAGNSVIMRSEWKRLGEPSLVE